MSRISFHQASLVNTGRGKVFSPVGDNDKKLSHTDTQFHNGQTRDGVHYPSMTNAESHPGSNATRLAAHKERDGWAGGRVRNVHQMRLRWRLA